MLRFQQEHSMGLFAVYLIVFVYVFAKGFLSIVL